MPAGAGQKEKPYSVDDSPFREAIDSGFGNGSVSESGSVLENIIN